MSAPKKKNKTEVAMTERQRQEAKEAKNLKVMTVTFVTAIILCVAIFVVSVASAPVMGLVYRNTKAVTVGEHTLSAVELNYFYVDAIRSYYNQMSSYISYFLDTSKSLDSQVASSSSGQTWADYFLEQAIENVKSTYALYDEATKKGFQLSEDDQASLDSMIDTLDTNIKYYASLYSGLGYSYPYSSAAGYIKTIYGTGASTKSYESYYEICYIADAYYAEYSDSLEYNDADLRAYEQDILTNYNSYTYNYYQLKASNYYEGGTEDEEGNITYSDEEKAAALNVVKELADKIAAGTCESLDKFDELLNTVLTEYELGKNIEDKGSTETETKEVSSAKSVDTLGTSVNSSFIDWLSEEGRVEGDMTVIEYATGEGDDKVINGYYVLCYGSTNDNTFYLSNVRHILIQPEGGTYNSTTGYYDYTEDELAAAKEEAEALLEQWKAGEATEDSFAELANKESADGDGTTGGLYEDISPATNFVESFKNWALDAHEAGDTEIVESVYGYHIMYFSGYSDINYRDYMITEDIRSEDVTAWHEALVEAISYTMLTDKYVDKGISMSEVIG